MAMPIQPSEPTRTWTVTFSVEAPLDYTESDIVDSVEAALDEAQPLSKHLDATFITAHRGDARC